ncbi:uncharacterized protein N7511_006508 [Penicillium nucicola]|uniref:uncharacterized protein n=1 Tax=Penicillium nucicola TaxID=1850975 RepID=UPI00254509CA|nr:uncharacterized protein N7511_006508 [Penicillium nucicola]KAJ5757814.1 hypothetical protein N7511_006508 [Penicillium nucicola]
MEDSGWNDSTDLLQGMDRSHDLKSHLPFDSSQPLLDLHRGSDLSLDPSSFLNGWSNPRDLYYSNYPSRMTADQDVWNPLLLTGIPASSSLSHMNMSAPLPEQEYCLSHHQFSDPSENGSQYMGSYSADSGYGGTSCATQSVVASSYGVDSSPQIGVKENAAGSAPFFTHSRYASGSSLASDLAGSPSQMFDGVFKCDHPSCEWSGKCPSDKRKHEARHRKLFKCDEPNCPRKEGFGTINDLARHKKCVHNKEPERGPKMMYKCFGSSCPRPNKNWPRLDNFKQHLSRMHHEEDGDALLKKSMDWYDKVNGRQAGQGFEERSSREESMSEEQEDLSSVQSTTELEPVFQEKSDLFTFGATQPTQYSTSIADSEPSQFPAFSPWGMSSTSQESPTERNNTKPDGSVTDAADNLINAMTKMMNNRNRKSSQTIDEGIEVESDNTQLTQLQRQMLQKVLSAALDRLSDEPDTTTQDSTQEQEKRSWFQCDACPKRTRLRCEMKKHQKRHERPYGCTFPHCAKSFGSKADWKRHETSQHLHVPSWICTAHDAHKGSPCERLFGKVDMYTQHVREHGVNEYEIAAGASENRLDLADDSQFWCGFCDRRIPLRSGGSAALDERFNHIDQDHFKKGERGADWRFPSASSVDAMDQALDGPSLAGLKNPSRKAAVLGTRKRKLAAV